MLTIWLWCGPFTRPSAYQTWENEINRSIFDKLVVRCELWPFVTWPLGPGLASITMNSFSILWLRRPICNRWFSITFLLTSNMAHLTENGENYGFWPTCDVIGLIKGNAVRLHYSAPAVLSNAVWISKIGPVVSKLAGCEWDTAPTVADRTLRGLQAFIPKANCPTSLSWSDRCSVPGWI